jgi:transposase
MLDISASAEGVFVFISQILSASSSIAPKRPALRAHNAHHFGRGKAAGPGLSARLVDSIEKAARTCTSYGTSDMQCMPPLTALTPAELFEDLKRL